MVQLSLSDILKNQFTKPLCPLLCVIVDQEEWLCTQEVNVLSLLIYAQKGGFVKNKYKIQLWPIFLSSIVFIFSLPPIYIYIYYYKKIILHGPGPLSTKIPLLPLPPRNLLDHVSGWCRPWSMSFGDLKLHGPSNIFPRSKPKWSRDEFNIQSQTLQGLGITSWSMV